MIILALKRVETYYDPDTWDEIEENNVIPIEYVVRDELHEEDLTICETLREAEEFIRWRSKKIIERGAK